MPSLIKFLCIVVVVIALGILWLLFRVDADPLMTPERMARIEASPHYKNGEFQPDVPHEPVKTDMSFWSAFLFPKEGFNIPAESMKAVKTDLKSLPKDEDLVVWMGHSSFYMQLAGKKILIDPVASVYASPFPLINKAFEGSNVYGPEDLPDDIDVMVLSHDHWDHLDYDFVRKIEPKVKQVVTGLGNGGYYEKWGYPLSKIHEVDWNEEVKLEDGFSVWVLPTRHFSGRMLKRNQTLPASFAFITPGRKVYYSGDGGYDGRFKNIGQTFGGFDLALMEDGQYNRNWHSVHMMPEESAAAAEEIGAKAIIPCHNGKYALSSHSWQEPYERLEKASEGKNYRLLTPEIGEVVRIGDDSQHFMEWWRMMQ